VITICLIGDSNLAALKLGWDAVGQEYGDVAATFFGARIARMQLRVCNESLVAETDWLRNRFQITSGGKSEIANNYDCYLVCGLGFGARRVAGVYRDYRAESQSRDNERQPISDECFRMAFCGRLRESQAITIIGYLRDITNAPIALVPMPMRSPLHPDESVKIIEQNGDDATVSDMFASAATLLSRDLKFSLLRQPESTFFGPLRTKPVYARASVNSTGDSPMVERDATDPMDHAHMNAAYGELVIRKIMDEFVRSSSASHVTTPEGVGYPPSP
jgi:hypothetical protein